MGAVIGKEQDHLVEKVGAIVFQTLDLSPDLLPLEPETRLFGTGLGLDSVEILQIVVALEMEFHITIEDAELRLENFRDIASVVSLIQKKVGADL